MMPIHSEAQGWAPATSAGPMAEMRRRDNIGKKEAPTCSRGQSPIARPNLTGHRRDKSPSQMGTASLLPVHGTLPATVRRPVDIFKAKEPPIRLRSPLYAVWAAAGAATYLTRDGRICFRGRSTRKYLRMNRPSRPFSGPPQR